MFLTAYFVKNPSSEIKCLHDFVQIVSIIHMKASGEVNECARGSDLCQMEKLAPRRRGFYLNFLPSFLRILSQRFRVNFGDHHTRWRFFFQPIDLCPLPKPDQAKSWVLFVYRRNRNSARLGCLLLNRRRCPPIYYTRRVRDDKIVSSITQIQKWFHGKIMNWYQINEI